MKKIFKISILPILLIVFLLFYYYPSDKGSADEVWQENIRSVQINSSIDSSQQDAYFLASSEKRPLIVSLHQWSSSFDKYDSLIEHAIENNWNYIRPNFRGPNNTPEAGGSELVIADIDDAIDYGIKHGNVDETKIYIIGASGGGHAALQHLMLSEKEIASYSAWVPITDLVAWYGESRIRKNGYYEDILAITESDEGSLNVQEARNRSPFYQETPIEKANNSIIQIYAGVNDGYDGAVPISHSIRFYNKLVSDLNLGDENLVPKKIESELLYTQSLGEEPSSTFSIDERDIIYSNVIDNLSLVIFDGNHEILTNDAFEILLGLN